MKNSHILQNDLEKKAELQQQLPKQWDYLSKRLTQVQKGLTLLQKKHGKLQKKLSSHDFQSNQFTAQLTQQLLHLKQTTLTKQQLKQQLMINIEHLQNEIKKQCLSLINLQFDNFNQIISQKNNHIQNKIKNIYDQNKLYIDRAILEIKQIGKKYHQEYTQMESKIGKSNRENSPSLLPKNSLLKSKSSKKLFQTVSAQKSQTFPQKNTQNTYEWLERSRENVNKEPPTSNSRVSYLRQKLKEFQKVNKKYEAEADKSTKKQVKEQVMKKMRNYRNYLQQSESELQPSSILTTQQAAHYQQTKKNHYPTS